MNETSSVLYCVLSGTGNVTQITATFPEWSSYPRNGRKFLERQTNAVCNCLVFQKPAFLITKDPSWGVPANKTAPLHSLFCYNRVWLWGQRISKWGSLGELPAAPWKSGPFHLVPCPHPSPWPQPLQCGFCCCHLSETSPPGVKTGSSCLPRAVVSLESLHILSAITPSPPFVRATPWRSCLLCFWDLYSPSPQLLPHWRLLLSLLCWFFPLFDFVFPWF